MRGCEVGRHKHVMVLQHGDGARSWFYCEGCPAVVDIVQRVDGGQVHCSARVRHQGDGGFEVEELIGLGRLWLSCFEAFLAALHPRPAPRRRRKSPARRAA